MYIYIYIYMCVCVCYNNNHTQCGIYKNMYYIFIQTYQGLYLWKYLWPKLSALCTVTEYLIELCLCHVKKVFNVGFMVPISHSQF
jgi:hypothetical protein